MAGRVFERVRSVILSGLWSLGIYNKYPDMWEIRKLFSSLDAGFGIWSNFDSGSQKLLSKVSIHAPLKCKNITPPNKKLKKVVSLFTTYSNSKSQLSTSPDIPISSKMDENTFKLQSNIDAWYHLVHQFLNHFHILILLFHPHQFSESLSSTVLAKIETNNAQLPLQEDAKKSYVTRVVPFITGGTIVEFLVDIYVTTRLIFILKNANKNACIWVFKRSIRYNFKIHSNHHYVITIDAEIVHAIEGKGQKNELSVKTIQTSILSSSDQTHSQIIDNDRIVVVSMKRISFFEL
ncbi:hypothetical protein RhiirC2_857222 [Rhizophagus irregularis]|uniref:Uncharacterized protein n=1 Tax=Rhizophagus irregularis TaxID=588596 RepID=A0A2N1MDL3_9GLOM|nr:hypothetical protein RhiirC2_857222 [Rhizophagus irregularis]